MSDDISSSYFSLLSINFRVSATVLLFIVSTQVVFSATGESLPLYYDLRTGNVTIDTTNVTGGRLISYGFHLPREKWLAVGLSFDSDAATPFMGAALTELSSKGISETNFSGVEPGVYSVGNILPAGLDEFGFLEYFGRSGGGFTDLYQYNAKGELGSKITNPFEPIYSPSPFPALNEGEGVIDARDIKWATEASLLYDPGSGGLTLDTTGTNGGTIWSYQLEFASDIVELTSVQLATDGMLADVDSFSITEIGANGIQEGVYALGNILSPNLSLGEVSELISRTAFIGEPGHGADSLNLDVGGVPFSLAFASALPLFGDANLDHVVDAADLNIVGENWLREDASGWPDGDFNGDQLVDQSDLNMLGENWHAEKTLTISPVPEPSSISLIVVLVGGMLAVRRRRHR